MSDQEYPDADENPYASTDAAQRTSRLATRISIPLAILLVVVIVICFYINLGLGIGATLVSIPAYLRAASDSRRRLELGEHLGTGHRVLSFIGSVAVVWVCAVAGAIAFLVTCTGTLIMFGSNLGQGGEWIIVGTATVGFFAAFIVLYRYWWPRGAKR